MTEPSYLARIDDPQEIARHIDAFIKQYPGKLSGTDQTTLQQDPELAATVFYHEGIQNLVVQGKLRIDDLHLNFPLQNALKNTDIDAAIKEGALSVKKLAKLPPENLTSANILLQQGVKNDLLLITGTAPEGAHLAANLLGLHTQTAEKKFVASIQHSHIDYLVDNFNKSAEWPIKESERKILKSDLVLAEKIFNGTFGDTLKNGDATVAELKAKPLLQTALQNVYVRGAIEERLIDSKTLAHLPPEQLSAVSTLLTLASEEESPVLRKEYATSAAQLLGIDARSQKLEDSIAHTKQRELLKNSAPEIIWPAPRSHPHEKHLSPFLKA
jgi:hypothetical protein